MANRKVTHTTKDEDGNITALHNPEEDWSPRDKVDAIRDIEEKIHTYYVHWPGGGRADIRVVDGPTGKHLRTTTPSADIAF